MDIRLTATGLQKVFNRRTIFREVSFSVGQGETLLISGRNGSGKSTLVKIIADVLTPSNGTVRLEVEGRVEVSLRQRQIGLVAPYLQVYEEFSAEENVLMGYALRGLAPDPGRAADLLESLGLGGRRKDLVRTFSSGMEQRVKYAMALAHSPGVLVLDEPMANLDAEGIDAVRAIMDGHRTHGVLVVATNDLTDVPQHDRRVDLNASR